MKISCKTALAAAFSLLAAIMCVCASGCGKEAAEALTPGDLQPAAAASASKDKVILLEYAPAASSYVGKYISIFKEELESRNVGLKVRIFPEASLVGHTERADRMLRENELQMKVSGGPYGILIRPLCYPSISGLTLAGFEEVMKNPQLKEWLDKKCEEEGLRYLGSLPSQMLGMSSRFPVRTVGDIADLRTRIEQSTAREEFWKALGAQVVYCNIGEAKASLEKNLFDANVNNILMDVASYGLFWDGGYYIFTDHEIYTYPLYVSRAFWDGLSPAQQEALEASVDSVCKKAADEAARLNEESLAKIISAGNEVLELSENEREKLLSETRDAVYEKMCATFGREHVDLMLSFIPQALSGH